MKLCCDCRLFDREDRFCMYLNEARSWDEEACGEWRSCHAIPASPRPQQKTRTVYRDRPKKEGSGFNLLDPFSWGLS